MFHLLGVVLEDLLSAFRGEFWGKGGGLASAKLSAVFSAHLVAPAVSFGHRKADAVICKNAFESCLVNASRIGEGVSDDVA